MCYTWRYAARFIVTYHILNRLSLACLAGHEACRPVTLVHSLTVADRTAKDRVCTVDTTGLTDETKHTNFWK
jgi:hypothetical protein